MKKLIIYLNYFRLNLSLGKSIETIKSIYNLGSGRDKCCYILLTVPEQDCPHSALGVEAVSGVPSQVLAPGAVPAKPVLGLA